MIEIRWHGRGGQGVVTSAELIAMAAIFENKFAVAIPYFGAERRGAPVTAFNRLSEKPIRIRSNIKNPDYVVILDPLLERIIDVYNGLKRESVLVVNNRKEPSIKKFKVAYVNATDIALRNGLVGGGIPIVGTAMIGALIRVSQILSLESVEKAIKEKWRNKVAEKNVKAFIEAYKSTKIKEGH